MTTATATSTSTATGNANVDEKPCGRGHFLPSTDAGKYAPGMRGGYRKIVA